MMELQYILHGQSSQTVLQSILPDYYAFDF